MNKVMVSGVDGFWARVRAALGRGEDALQPAYGRSEIGRSNRLPRPAQRIDDELRRGWDEAAQRRVSLCVLLMEMDGLAEYVAAYGREALEPTLHVLETTIRALLPRETDLCLRSGRGGFALILPDMPLLMARDLASRVAAAVRKAGLAHRESHAGQVTLSMGLAAVNPHGALDRNVFATATDAVKKAQRRGLARLEVVDLRGEGDKRKAA
jgi:diguanylate cyclase (GGDEF)-like protein